MQDPQIDDDVPEDELPDEPSRSARRRDALEVFDLAEALVALSEAELARVPMSDELRDLVSESRRITSHGARKRQLQFLAKQLRRVPDELQPMRDALEHDEALARRETARLHRIEALRDRLVAGGDEALTEVMAEHPGADRQRLRQLVRRAQEEKRDGKPHAAAREIFRVLRELLDE